MNATLISMLINDLLEATEEAAKYRGPAYNPTMGEQQMLEARIKYLNAQVMVCYYDRQLIGAGVPRCDEATLLEARDAYVRIRLETQERLDALTN